MQSIKSILKFFLVIGVMFASFYSLTANAAQIAVGSWGYNNSVYDQPMILLDSSQGDSWSFLKTLSIPSMKSSELKAASCMGNFCNATGYFQKDYETTFPLLMTSQDKGQNWSMVNKVFGIPAWANRTFVENIQCAEGVCVAVGRFRNDKDTYYEPTPLLLISKDNGLSWSYNNSALTHLKGKGELSLVAHSGNTWIVGGYYNHYFFVFNRATPLLLISKDNGKTWRQLTANFGLPPFSEVFISTNINAMQCKDDVCFVVGWHGTRIDEEKKPFMMRSNNNGQTWSLVNFPGLAHNTENPDLRTISCVENICVAAGDWEFEPGASSHIVPLLLTSHDKGATWSYVNVAKNLPVHTENAVLSSVSCTGQNCVAGGAFANKQNTSGLPLLMSSQDQGLSWSFVTKILNLPTQFKDAWINTVNCHENHCTVAGSWESNASEKFPLFLVSHDKGQTWTYVQNITDFPVGGNGSVKELLML